MSKIIDGLKDVIRYAHGDKSAARESQVWPCRWSDRFNRCLRLKCSNARQCNGYITTEMPFPTPPEQPK